MDTIRLNQLSALLDSVLEFGDLSVLKGIMKEARADPRKHGLTWDGMAKPRGKWKVKRTPTFSHAVVTPNNKEVHVKKPNKHPVFDYLHETGHVLGGESADKLSKLGKRASKIGRDDFGSIAGESTQRRSGIAMRTVLDSEKEANKNAIGLLKKHGASSTLTSKYKSQAKKSLKTYQEGMKWKSVAGENKISPNPKILKGKDALDRRTEIGNAKAFSSLQDDLIELASALRSRITIKTRPTSSGFKTHALHLNGKHVGTIGVTETGEVEYSGLHDRFKNLGLGKKLYGEAIRREPTGTIHSDRTSLSDDAKRVYESMKKRPKSYRVTQDDHGHYTAKINRKAIIQ